MTQNTIALTRRRFVAVAGVSALLPQIGHAAPRKYNLDAAASKVGFVFALNGVKQKGSMPISSAKIMIDRDNLAKSTVDVTVSVKKAKTGMIFATDALKSPEVLNAAQYPTIRFQSTSVKLGANGRISEGAALRGNLTVRGVTKPVTFNANLYRAAGSAADDLDNLTVRLTGAISRGAYGASGFANLVDDSIALDILAVVNAS